jgi:hypothetical protein
MGCSKRLTSLLIPLVALSGCLLTVSTKDLSGGSRADGGLNGVGDGSSGAIADARAGDANAQTDASEAAAGDGRIVWSGNGHTYEVVIVPGGVSWQDARDLAANRGGHLATLGTQEENDFVMTWLHGHPEAFNASDVGPWLGGYQPNPTPADEPAGGWQWIDGTPWTFTAWHSGQPDNSDNAENYLTAFNRGGAYEWNDDQPSGTAKPIFSYLVEIER